MSALDLGVWIYLIVLPAGAAVCLIGNVIAGVRADRRRARRARR